MKRMGKAVALTAMLWLWLGAVGSVLAADQQDAKVTRQTVAMSERVYKRLKAIQDLLETKGFDAVAPMLRELDDLNNLSAYERAQIHNITAYFFYLQEKYPAAIESYRKLLEQEPLPEALVQSTLKTLGQLYFATEQYGKVFDPVERLLSLLDAPEAELYILLGSAYFQLQRYDDALSPIKTAVAISRRQGQVPRENWLLLLRAIYHAKNNYQDMLDVLVELMTHYPKDDYLRAMAGVYSELGDTRKQLAVTEALYENGSLDNPAEIVNLANLLLLHGIPYKAAKLLEKELAAQRVETTIKNLRLLSQAWYQAREDQKAIPPLELAAARSDDGELYTRLAQSYMELERWADAARALQTGLAKGGIKRVDTANVMLGMALFNQEQLDLAQSAFENAVRDQRS
ncbi:MAG: tetratricopeptide repeat protein, partial [Gammaproteobacteria bacterium]|nr:tetratricopeptide repeat protein [Gammaproteobacteria bacterium]